MPESFLAAVKAATKVLHTAPQLLVWEDEGKFEYEAKWVGVLALCPAVNCVRGSWWTEEGERAFDAAVVAVGSNTTH